MTDLEEYTICIRRQLNTSRVVESKLTLPYWFPSGTSLKDVEAFWSLMSKDGYKGWELEKVYDFNMNLLN